MFYLKKNKKSKSQVKVKARYSKFGARMLATGVCGVICCLIIMIEPMFEGKNVDFKNVSGIFLIFIPFILLPTLVIISRSPKGERLKTWFRALGFGWRVCFYGALSLISSVSTASLTIDERDYNYYLGKDGDIVKDDDGIEHKVVGGGSFVEYNGNWHKIRCDCGEAYIEDGLRKIWLKNG